MENKLITIGIPVYKAEKYICDCLASIQIQTIKDKLAIIIAKDNPEEDYSFVKDRYPDLDITILECEKNTGPGLARQRCIDAAKTQWITFIDADDVFYTPLALEEMKKEITPNCIDIQTTFFEEIIPFNQKEIAYLLPMISEDNSWVFGHLYNISLLNQYGIRFSSLRSVEDGEFNWKIQLLVCQPNFPIIKKYKDVKTYLWKCHNDHSITRVGMDKNNGEPPYTWDWGEIGHTIATINVAKFLKKQNPLNPNIPYFIAGQMINKYFHYIQCLYKQPQFAAINFFNAKRFYHACYKEIEDTLDKNILRESYSTWYKQYLQEMEMIIPPITFLQFIDRIKKSKYGGKEEFLELRSKLPSWIDEEYQKTGLLGKEEYVYADGEEQ